MLPRCPCLARGTVARENQRAARLATKQHEAEEACSPVAGMETLEIQQLQWKPPRQWLFFFKFKSRLLSITSIRDTKASSGTVDVLKPPNI